MRVKQTRDLSNLKSNRGRQEADPNWNRKNPQTAGSKNPQADVSKTKLGSWSLKKSTTEISETPIWTPEDLQTEVGKKIQEDEDSKGSKLKIQKQTETSKSKWRFKTLKL